MDETTRRATIASTVDLETLNCQIIMNSLFSCKYLTCTVVGKLNKLVEYIHLFVRFK